MEDVAEPTIWTIERDGADCRHGRWEANVVAVGPAGVSVLAQLEGWARSGSATLALQLIAETPPSEVLGDLVRETVRLAAEFGATRIVCPLGPPCPAEVDGVVLRPKDGRHFDGDGSNWVASHLLDRLFEVLAGGPASP